MNYALGANPLQEYQQIRNAGAEGGLTPNQLIQMLMQGAIEGIAMAKGHLQRGEIARKGEQISRVIGIIDGLRACLNIEAGGDLAQRLSALYDYMERRLLRANLYNEVAMLDEVAGLLGEIKNAWDTITAVSAEVEPRPQTLVAIG